MAAYDTYSVDSIDSNVGQFKVEKGKYVTFDGKMERQSSCLVKKMNVI